MECKYLVDQLECFSPERPNPTYRDLEKII